MGVRLTMDPDVFFDKVLGCWLGKNAGGTLGEPFEEKFGKDEMFSVSWYTQLTEGGIPNDDLEMQLIWLQKYLEKGPGITSADLIDAWMDCVSYNFDEYGLSKTNMKKGLLPPVCGWHNNAFRDCMGSPIRSELWACLAPGRPDIAAHYAFLDAICDHGGGESVYGEIYNACVQSAAFVLSDRELLANIGLSAIPADSLTAQSISMAVDLWRKSIPFKDARNLLKERFYNPVSQYSPLNLGFQTLAWFYTDTFGDAICSAVNCGWDTDCTAATLGATYGILHGASGLPKRWIAPLGDTIRTNMTTGGIRNLTAPTDIHELTRIVCEQAEKTLRYWNTDLCLEKGAGGILCQVPRAVPVPFLKNYLPNALPFQAGGFDGKLIYHEHAAIVAGAPSVVEVRLRNLHPETRTIIVHPRMPEGFSLQPQRVSLSISPGDEAAQQFAISAGPGAIYESNRGQLELTCEEHPAMPSVPLVLIGGVRWLASPFFPGKTLEDACGVAEQAVFTRPLEGFEEIWRTGNDLLLEDRLTEPGVLYLLGQIHSELRQEVVIGVPNTGRMRIWLNGAFLHQSAHVSPLRANQGNGGALGDLANYHVTALEAGWNQVLVKLEAVAVPCRAHFTLGGIHPFCVKNHGEPVLHIRQSVFPWESGNDASQPIGL